MEVCPRLFNNSSVIYLKVFRVIICILVLVISFLSFSLFFAQQVRAATYYINSNTGNDTTGSGSSGSPYATFNKGYTTASSGDTLDLTGTFDWSSAAETGDASGSGYTINKNLTIQGQGVGSTIVQASSTSGTANRSVFTISSGRTVTIKNMTIRYGVTTAGSTGGGITNNGTLTLQGVAVSNNAYNTTSYYGAGGIFGAENSTLTLATTTVSNNTFTGRYYGSGGFFSTQSVTVTVNGSTFSGNTTTSDNPTTFAYSYAEPSGAFGVFRFCTVTITNSTFSGNTTNSYGGAMQIYLPYTFNLTNVTVANNTASAGAGGILLEASTGYNTYVKNTILANNTGNSTANDFYMVTGSPLTDNGYNIVEYSTNKTWSGTGVITGNQASLNLASSVADNSATNGIQTLALSSGSVAIDAGNSSSNNSIAIPSYDSRGATRSGTTDIGAFEYGGGGLADITLPTVSLTAPTASETVSGSAVAFSATASDNIAVAGVKFYVNGVLQGSEDTTSSYGISWDSTATSSGSYTAVAVARDSSNNYATSSSVSFTVDNTTPVFSSISASSTSSGAVITWTSDSLTSTQVNFGLTSSYGSSTTEADTSPRVTSHSVTISGLPVCTRFYYQVQGKNAALTTATSSASTWRTAGCTGNATVTATGDNSITVAAGGTLTEGVITLNVPTSFTSASSSAVFQAHQLDGTTFFASAGAPTDKTAVGTNVYTLRALIDATTTVSSFSSAITVTMTYSDSDIVGIDETSLKIYRYDSSTWSELSNCAVNTSSKTVSCETTAFSDFAIFGDEDSDDSESSRRSGPGQRIQDRVKNLIAAGRLEQAEQLKRQWPHLFTVSANILDNANVNITTTVLTPTSSQVTIPVIPVAPMQIIPTAIVRKTADSKSIKISKILRPQDTDPEIKILQEFLNRQGFILAKYGPGSPGNETEYFGVKTQISLVKFQEQHRAEILEPLGLTNGTGIVGPRTLLVIRNIF